MSDTFLEMIAVIAFDHNSKTPFRIGGIGRSMSICYLKHYTLAIPDNFDQFIRKNYLGKNSLWTF